MDPISVAPAVIMEIEIRIEEIDRAKKQIQNLLRLARGGKQTVPISEPTPSMTGRKSKCIELSQPPTQRRLGK